MAIPAAEPLESIPTIGRMPQSGLAEQQPVRIDGRITLVLPGRKVVYMDAEGMSVAVSLSKEPNNLMMGRRARVDGRTIAGRAWRVVADKLELLDGDKVLSETPVLTVSEFLAAPKMHQVVELRGVVRQRQTNPGRCDILLGDGPKKIPFKVFGVSPHNEPKRLLYSTTRIRGIAIPVRKGISFETFSWFNVHVEHTEQKFPFQTPMVSVADVQDLLPEDFPNGSVRIRGRFSELRSDGGVVLSDDTGKIELLPSVEQEMKAQVGDVIDALGYVAPSPDGGKHRLEQVRSRVLGLSFEAAKDPSKVADWKSYRILIENVKQVRSLNREFLEQRPPVQVEGNIMHVDPSQKRFVLQDATAGIEVVSFQANFAVRPGAHVRVIGHANRGKAATVIGDAAVTHLSDSRVADAIVPTSAGLTSGSYDGTWVEWTGVGRSVQFFQEGIRLVLAHEDTRIAVRLPTTAKPDFVNNLVDAWVRVVGLAQTLQNDRGEVTGTAIEVGGVEGITVLDAAPDVRDIEERPIAELGRTNPDEQFTRRQRSRGTVVLVWPQLVYLTEGTNSLRVVPAETPSVTAGQVAEAIGFPESGLSEMSYHDAMLNGTDERQKLAPRLMGKDERLASGNAGEFIEVDATLVKQVTAASEALLIMRAGAENFSAALPKAMVDDRMRSLLEGSLLRLRGVLTIEVAPGGRTRAARILLPDAKAIALLQAPPWWTVEKLLAALGLMAVGIAFALGRSIYLQRKVQHSQSQLTNAALASPVAVVILSAEDGRIFEVNDRFLTDLRFRRENVTGKTLDGLGIWTEKDRLQRLRRMAGKKDEHVHATWNTSAEVPRTMVVSAEEIEFDARPCLVVSAVDITEKTELLEQLRDSQKLEAVGQLAAGVAHDFNNLLTIINGNAEIIDDELEQESPIRELNDEVVNAGTRAAELTKQLLAFSRKQVLRDDRLELGGLLKSSLRMLRRLLPATVDVAFEYSEEPCWVKGDRGMLDQVLVNLAVNARDAMKDKGTLSLKLDEIEVDEEQAEDLPDAKPGRFARLTVSDTGCGMDESTLARAFEPFFTTKDIGAGTGLGLATVYGIVRQHRGWVRVNSEPDQGAVFQIHLPAVEPAKPDTEDEDEISPNLKGTEKILLAEDEPAVRRIAERVLTRAGHQVITAEDGEKALEKWKEHGGDFEVLVSDVLMPNMSGIELARELIDRNPDLIIVLISGYSGDKFDLKELDEMGAAFIDKPVTQEALLGRIRELIGKQAQVSM